MRSLRYMAFFILLLTAGCSTLVLKPADFAWPVESVNKVENNGLVEVKRYSFSFNAKELFLKETGDSLGYKDQEIRIIRNDNGFYFMTANNFKNVYVFNNKKGSFSLEKKIEISDSTGMQNPAFNQRPPYIELVYGDKTAKLTENGIKKEEVKK